MAEHARPMPDARASMVHKLVDIRERALAGELTLQQAEAEAKQVLPLTYDYWMHGLRYRMRQAGARGGLEKRHG